VFVAEETCDCLLPSTSSSTWATVVTVAVFAGAVLVGAVLAWRRSLRTGDDTASDVATDEVGAGGEGGGSGAGSATEDRPAERV
jgi:hypothetical protein